MANEQVQAANALISWFNSQEIPMSEAKIIMTKVIAKMIVLDPKDTVSMRENYDRFVITLANEVNDRALAVLHNRKK